LYFEFSTLSAPPLARVGIPPLGKGGGFHVLMLFFSKKQKNKSGIKSWHKEKDKVYPTIRGKKAGKPRRRFSRFLFWLLFFGFLGICVYLALFSPYLDLTKISIEGNQDIPAKSISNSVRESLDGKYFDLFPKNNFFLANKKSIKSSIKSDFKNVDITSISKIFPDAITIKIVERKAKLAWCSGGACYFVDRTGLAYGGASEDEEKLRIKNFLVVVDDSAIPVKIEETKIDPEFVGYIEAVNAMVTDDLKINLIGSVHTPAAASKEISLETVEGWILKLSMEYSNDESKKIIQALFESELNEEARKNLEYLDLRVKGKVYYKLKVQN
jgi:cell division septal protein FtsQ